VAITISNLTNKKGANLHSFSDLHLDLKEQKVSTNVKNTNIVAGNDILADVDELAIRNSLINILTQNRYLNPMFNVNLRKYIGRTPSDMVAMNIAQDIDRGIALFEPRVRVDKVLVAPDYTTNSYVVALVLYLHNFNKTMMYNGVISNTWEFNLLN
jgi:phage baseplate assembly protein W